MPLSLLPFHSVSKNPKGISSRRGLKLHGRIYLGTSTAEGIQASGQESGGEGNRCWSGSVFFLIALSADIRKQSQKGRTSRNLSSPCKPFILQSWGPCGAATESPLPWVFWVKFNFLKLENHHFLLPTLSLLPLLQFTLKKKMVTASLSECTKHDFKSLAY